MLIAGFPAGSFAANCYIVASGPGAECLIIDPGEDAEAGIEEIISEHRLRPAAVLATHGHIDHIWSVAPVCGIEGHPVGKFTYVIGFAESEAAEQLLASHQ